MGLLTSSVFKQTSIQPAVELLAELLADYPTHNFQVRFWDGTTWGSKQPRFTLVLKHPGALREVFLSPSELTLGESYIFDDLDIEGDIEGGLDLADYLLTRDSQGLSQKLHLASALRKLPLRQEMRTEHPTRT